MNKVKLACMAVLASATFTAAQAGAYSVTITDSYRGSNKADVVGDSRIFDVNQMVVNFSGSRLSSVDISTSYVKPLTDVGASGTMLGDLFVSTNGYGATNMTSDTMFTGEQWEYALVLSQHDFGCSLPGERDRTISLYRVAGDRSNIVKSYAPYGYIYRENQETLINKSKPVYLLGTIGTWDINNTQAGGYGILSFELTNTALVDRYLGSGNFGFHWNMTCGNDTIEGGASAPVPEPSTFVLLGAGLLGAGLYRRKRKS
jgi:hypothetical protein